MKSKLRRRSSSRGRNSSIAFDPIDSNVVQGGANDTKSVGFKAIFRNINHVDTQNQTFYVDMWVCAYNTDDPSSTNSFQNSYGEPNVVFNETYPKWSITFLNAKELIYGYKEKGLPTIRDFQDGKFFERQYIQGTFSQAFNLRYFPFDEQTLRIKISLDVATNIAEFDPKKIQVYCDQGHCDILQQTEWTFLNKPRVFVYSRAGTIIFCWLIFSTFFIIIHSYCKYLYCCRRK